MGSINNPIGEGPIDPVSGQSSKYHPEAFPSKGPAPDEKLAIASALLQIFQNAADLILAGASAGKSIQKDARDNLLLLKACFDTLKKEDRSQDVGFLTKMAALWRHCLEDTLHFKNDAASAKFTTLVKKIQHYPENQQHTFGYYLSEYADPKWVPFPYMELIAKIHFEHAISPLSSALNDWSSLIDELLVLLKLGPS